MDKSQNSHVWKEPYQKYYLYFHCLYTKLSKMQSNLECRRLSKHCRWWGEGKESWISEGQEKTHGIYIYICLLVYELIVPLLFTYFKVHAVYIHWLYLNAEKSVGIQVCSVIVIMSVNCYIHEENLGILNKLLNTVYPLSPFLTTSHLMEG